MRRVRTLNGCLLIMLGVGPISVANYVWAGARAAALGIVVSYAVAIVALVHLRVTKRLELAGHLATIALLLVVFYLLHFLGGLNAISQGWLVTPPILAGLVLGRRAALVYSALTVGEILYFALLEHAGMTPEIAIRPELVTAFAVLAQVQLVLAVAAMIYAFLASQQASEAALRGQEVQTRVVIESAADGILVIDPGGTISAANPAAARMFGLGPGDLVGRDVLGLIAAEHRARFAAFSSGPPPSERLPGNEPARDEFEAVRNDGRLIHVEFSISEISGASGRSMTAFVRDVTERRRAQDALVASEARFRAMSGASPLGIFMADPQQTLNYSNAVFQEIFGVGEAEAGAAWRASIHPEDLPRVEQAWAAIRDGGQVGSSVHRVVRRDGAVRWVSVKVAPVRDEAELIGFIGTVEDITSLRVAEDELRRY